MAKDAKQSEAGPSEPPVFTEADKQKARAWFKKGNTLREQHNHDYAIESFITGLAFWPEAVEEGHMPLWSIAIQRQQAGGKKPGMLDGMKFSMTGKDAKQNMLNAELLHSKDPGNGGYLDGFLKNAAKADYVETVKFLAPKILDTLRREKKGGGAGRFKNYKQCLVEVAERCNDRGDVAAAVLLLEHAVQSIEILIGQNPGDMALKEEQRDLAGKLTITKGKYSEAGSFRESVLDMDKQKLLHDQERVKQGESTLENLLDAARREFEANPTVAGKVNALVDALTKTDRKQDEDEALSVLDRAFRESNNYSFKVRYDDLRLRQVSRVTRQLKAKAAQSGSEDDGQQARLAEMDEIATEVDIFEDRAKNYPTDLRIKYRLGAAYFRSGDYDRAIPILQVAQGDPRNRARCQMLIGRAFLDKGIPGQAAEIIKEAIEGLEVASDDTGKEMLFWLAQAQEAAGQIEEARNSYGKLLRQDYNYADGEARRRLDALPRPG
ncbi:MAG: hypothetical protein AMXMBFR47_06610 [Planctomycetota bacterium]